MPQTTAKQSNRDETTDDESSVGAIMAIDGDVPNKENRRKWAQSLASELGEITGVVETRISPTDSYNNNFVIYVTVEASETITGYDLHVNTRSMGQRIRSVLDADVPANANLFDPEFESPDSMGGGVYDSDTYAIHVSYP